MLQQLLPPDDWTPGRLVIHSHAGVGKILGTDPADPSKRVIAFLGTTARRSVPTVELRRLLSGTQIAQRIAVSRKAFLKGAARRGIAPDYVGSRVLYDEGRLNEIREQWSARPAVSAAQAGWVILDEHDEVARIEYVCPNAQLWVRTLADGKLTQQPNLFHPRRLVSTRELARRERISRYKLNRLLCLAGVQPVHQDATTVYFDLETARAAVHTRIDREHDATRLYDVARRCSVRPQLLARKARQGCVRTIGGTTYAVDQAEAQRIQRLDRARRTGWQRLREQGICRVQPRGRHGFEVVGWDLGRLIRVAETVSLPRREALFEELAWACDGAAQRRFQEALNDTLWQWRTRPDRQARQAAQLLLTVFRHLPNTLVVSCRDIALVAAGGLQRYCVDPGWLRWVANEAGCRTECAHQRFIQETDYRVAQLLTSDDVLAFGSRAEPIAGAASHDDEFVPGAVTLAASNKQPLVGIIVCVEQRSWNALTRSWDKTIVVRYGSEEVRVNPCAKGTGIAATTRPPALRVLLRFADTLALERAMRELMMITTNPDTRQLSLSRAS